MPLRLLSRGGVRAGRVPDPTLVGDELFITSTLPVNFQPTDTDQVTWEFRRGNGDVVSASATYSTSSGSIATVSAGGLVTAVAPGSVTITVNVNGHLKALTYTVTNPISAVASVVPSISSGAVTAGGTLNFTVEARDASSNVLVGKTFTAVSDDVTKATVSVSGSTISVVGVAAGSPNITVTCETVDSSPVAITVSAQITGYPNLPASFIHTIGRHFNTKAGSNGDRGTGSLPYKTTGSEGFDGIEYQYSKISITTDATAPLSASNVMQFLYNAQTVGAGATYSPGTSQTLDFQNALYSGLSVGSAMRMYVRFALKLSANFYGHSTSTNKVVFLRSTSPAGKRFEPIFRFRGVGAGPLKINVDLQGSTSDSRNNTGGLDPNTAGAAGAGANNVPRDTWHVFEVLLYTGTFDNSNGEVKIWMNGVQTHDYTDIRFHIPAMGAQAYWAAWHQDPTWGGQAGTIPADMQLWMDDVDIYLKAT